ncbi:MAG TPA: hypothetical protein V6C58_22550 [Allocoleopsis sp.]
MNTQLIESLAQIILSLSEEEKTLLTGKLNQKKDWETQLNKIEELRQKIHQNRNININEISVDDIFEQMREDRYQQFL